MKNIFDLLKEYGVELPEDKKKDFEKAMLENYKTIKDYDAQKEKLTAAEQKNATSETTINELKEDLKKFDGKDVGALEQKITDLQTELSNKDQDYANKIADRDFNDLISGSILAAKGRNVKAISALLDLDKLKGSKNQKEDIEAALKALSEAEDSKMLFGTDEPTRTGTVIGSVTEKNSNADDAMMRAAMGLPPVKSE